MSIKSILKKSFLYLFWVSYKRKSEKLAKDRKLLAEWNKNDRPVPPPQIYKRQVLKEYAQKFQLKVFLETGTYIGDTTEDCRKIFDKIFSIELDDVLFEKATKRFEAYSHISIVHGDSGQKIEEILSKINEPCLFWLDGHYSAGITAKGELNTPIINELDHIFHHQIDSHVILIDDARCFVGKDDYPSIEELRKYVMGRRPSLQFIVADDIIRIHK